MNKPMVKEIDAMLPGLSFQRKLNRPYFVSEWDMPWPNEWRAESPIYLAAIGAFQNWAGFAIHTYSYSTLKDIKITGKEVSSRAIGSVPYREGIFSAWNDPAKFGLFYHCALLLRRGDVKSANESYEILVDDMALTPEEIPALSLITEKHKVGMCFDPKENKNKNTIMPDQKIVIGDKGEVLSDTGEIYRSWEKGIGWIDSERTKAVYGFVGSIPRIDLKGISFKVKTDFATIALSSLTDKPLHLSDNILLTAVGRSENTDMKFNEERNRLLDIGCPPILIEAIEVDIELKTELETLKVWAVNAEGFYAGVIPSTYEDGVLKFSLGKEFASMYYLIQAE